MASKNEIHEFASRWLRKYCNPDSLECDVTALFADECRALGFVMDSGKSLDEAYENTSVFRDVSYLCGVIGRIDDDALLGSAIYSKWYVLTHGEREDLLYLPNRNWFIVALSRLKTITDENDQQSGLFQGRARKIELISNKVIRGRVPVPDKEVGQHLEMSEDGHVRFSGFIFGQGERSHECARTKDFIIDKEDAGYIMESVGACFRTRIEEASDIVVGYWVMKITNEDDRVYEFSGFIGYDFNISGSNPSYLIRDTLQMPDLFVFDGKFILDRVERVHVSYHRTSIFGREDSTEERPDFITGNYSEDLTLDRKTETCEHIQRVASETIITRTYYLKDCISDLLDSLDVNYVFGCTTDDSTNVISDPKESKNFEITVDFYRRPQLVLRGTYDSNGLPEKWPDFVESVLDIIRFYGIGEIFNKSIYEKKLRRPGDYIFCSVEFNEAGRSYYYITEDESLSEGDYVLVPVGNKARPAIVKIVEIEYFQAAESPMPLEKVKRVIRKCTDEDFHTSIEAHNLSSEISQRDNNKQTVTPFVDMRSTMPFDHIELCHEEHKRITVSVWADISNGCLCVSEQDLGAAVEDFCGENEMEYFYNFDKENTALLFAILAVDGRDIRETFVKKFSGMEGCSLLKEFCEKNNILYTIHSC